MCFVMKQLNVKELMQNLITIRKDNFCSTKVLLTRFTIHVYMTEILNAGNLDVGNLDVRNLDDGNLDICGL